MTAITTVRGLWSARRFLSATWLTLGVALVLTLVVSLRYPVILVNTLVTGGMWALMAAGLALVFGVMNIPNFAHGEFFMIGTLVAYYVFTPIQRALRGGARRSSAPWRRSPASGRPSWWASSSASPSSSCSSAGCGGGAARAGW